MIRRKQSECDENRPAKQRGYVSVSLSIFQKVCPECASSVSVSAETCSCGHRFESESDAASSNEAALRDEELYESYLAARAEQARQAMLTAFETHSANPGDTEKKAALELSRDVAKEVEDDLRVQREKIAALRNSSSSAAVAPKTNPAPAGLPTLNAAVTRPAPAAAPKQTAPKAQQAAAIPAAPRPAAPAPVMTNTPAVSASRAASVLSALKNAKAREAAPAVPALSSLPQFRQEQASRADKVMETLVTESGVNCPNCTASVPLNTARCRCGYSFPSTGANDLPSLTLCTGDFTALRNNFLKDLNGGR